MKRRCLHSLVLIAFLFSFRTYSQNTAKLFSKEPTINGTISKITNTNATPIANFKANKQFTCDGIINFTDTSCCNVSGWLWNFGDGTTSTVQNPTHTYTVNGIYTVSLQVTNSSGTNTITKNNYLTVALGSGPVAASCSPQTTGYCCGFGITNVTFAGINKTTADASDGYSDYTCIAGTNVNAGATYAISVNTPQPASHNVRVWIDYDNDGTFNSTTELAFSANSTLTATGNITIPGGTVINTPLRMRVSADFDGFAVPTPCGNLTYGQAEDYTVTILQNTNPPATEFMANVTTTCDGVVSFTDQSQNTPTSWLWNFGDGATDTLQNPVHAYTANGVYNVTLTATNIYGTNTIVKNSYINVTLGNAPVNAACSPATASYCCGYGIFNVKLNTINNATGSAAEGYKDFSCSNSTTLTESYVYNLSVQTSAVDSQDTKVWIDWDNNGSFNNTSELIASSLNHSGININYTVPAGVTLNTPLRMRVSSDYSGSNPSSCTSPVYGQVEDYGVTIVPNLNPPVAAFNLSPAYSCDGIISFIDSSFNPINSWYWDFGDGATSTVQNPVHTYTNLGQYTVTLIVTNTYGADTLIKTNCVNVISLTGGIIAASCTPQTTAFCCGMGITNVTLNTLNNTTPNASEGYQEFGCTMQTSLIAGQNYALSVTTGTQYSENVIVWIDYNNDGSFNSTEQVYQNYSLQNHTGNITVSSSAQFNTPLRMRVMSDYNTINNACTNVQYGQAEDYTVIILPNTIPPVTSFSANTTTTCNGVISFINTTSNGTSFFWNFGDGNTSSQQNPSHTYAAPGTYTVFLKSCNAYGCDSITIANYITVSTGGPVSPSCTPQTTSFCCGMGIYNVTFNSINNTTQNGADSYKDYSCTNQTSVTAGQNYNLSVTTGTQYAEYVTVWIDYNNDGVFNNSTEQIFANQSTQNHSASISISASAVLNTPLRMRVSSDYTVITDACNNVQYGQVEDYSVTILPNTVPPIVTFNANTTTTCNGIIIFNNTTTNATSFLWNFGDGSTSTQQNPTHTYATTGTYSVSLKACNAFGCDSLNYNNYVTVTTGGPITASCAPQTTANCCGIGIYNVSFSTINNSTADGSDGYKDYSCTHQTSVTAGQNYNLSVTTGSQYNEYVAVWIDYNNDGAFNNSNERIYTNSNYQTHTTSVTISSAAVLNAPLRMRVVSDYNNITDACTNVQYGQGEDYSVTIIPNTVPPVVTFNANTTNTCNGIITFNNSTTNGVSFFWDFGDGTTSTQQNPTHTYATAGTYSVFLKACNAFGCDSLLKTSYITVSTGGPITASCAPQTNAYCCGMGIYNVTFNTINNSSADGSDNYKDYSCTMQTSVTAAQGYTISITTGTQYSEYLKVWIDYNNDGSFNNSNEMVYNDYAVQTHSGTINISSSAVLNSPLRMRIASDYNNIVDACTNVQYGQAEDYSITILPNTTPPVAGFNAISSNCNGVIPFTNTTSNATSFTWYFGDGTTDTQQNISHSYTTAGVYNVSLVACNAFGCDSVTIPVVVNIGGPIAASCTPATTANCCGIGIYNVSFAGINNTTADGIDGYKDYACSQQTGVMEGQSYAVSVTTNVQYSEYVNVWIDYNNDGSFNTGELVYSGSGLQYHSGNIWIPTGTVLNTPLRMRVMSDYNTLTTACANVQYGQTEDYQVTIISNNSAPIASYTTTIANCSNTVAFNNTTTTNATAWNWNFGDGSANSTSQTVTHTYTVPGTYTVTLTAANGFGTDTYSNVVTVSFITAGFNIADTVFVGSNTLFQNASVGGNSCMWDFGDSTISMSYNPYHAFSSQGTYNVTLDISNGNCSDSITHTVVAVYDPSGIKNAITDVNFELWPNPSDGLVNLSIQGALNNEVMISIYNTLGEIILKENIKKTGNIKKSINLSDKANGLYFIKINTGEKEITRKILISK